MDLQSSMKATSYLSEELGSTKFSWKVDPTLTMAKAQTQLMTDKTQLVEGIMSLLGKVKADPTSLSRSSVDMQATQIAASAKNLAAGCRNMRSLVGDRNGRPLVAGAMSVASSIADMFSVLQTVLNDPNDIASVIGLAGVEKALQNSQMLLESVKAEHLVDEGALKLMTGSIAEVEANMAHLLHTTELCAEYLPPEDKEKLLVEAKKLEARTGWLFKSAAELSPVVLCEPAANELNRVRVELKDLTNRFQTKNASFIQPTNPHHRNFNDAATAVCDSLVHLLEATKTSESGGIEGIVDFATPVALFQNALTELQSALAETTGLVEAQKQVIAGPPVVPVAKLLELSNTYLERAEKKREEERAKLESELVLLEEEERKLREEQAKAQSRLENALNSVASLQTFDPTAVGVGGLQKKLGVEQKMEESEFKFTTEEKNHIEKLLEAAKKIAKPSQDLQKVMSLLQESCGLEATPITMKSVKQKIGKLGTITAAAAIPIDEINNFVTTEGKPPTTLRTDPLIKLVKDITRSGNDLASAASKISVASSQDVRNRLVSETEVLKSGIKLLVDQARELFKDPTNPMLISKTSTYGQKLSASVEKLISDAGENSAQSDLRYAAKVTSADCLLLLNQVRQIEGNVTNKQAGTDLQDVAKLVSTALTDFMSEIQTASQNPKDFVKQFDLLVGSRKQTAQFNMLLNKSKLAAKYIDDQTKKQQFLESVNKTNASLLNLMKAIVTVGDITGLNKIEEALEDFDSVKVDLDTAEFSAAHGELPRIQGQTRDNALELLAISTKAHTQAVDNIVQASTKGEKLPSYISVCAGTISQVATAVRAVASTITDREAQSRIIAAAQELNAETLNVISLCRVQAVDVSSGMKLSNLLRGQKKFIATTSALLAAPRGFDSREVNEALDFLSNCMETLNTVPKRTAPATDIEQKESASTLASASKALSAAVSQFTAVALTAPQGFGAMAKVIATTSGQFISAASVTLSINPELAESIKDTTATIVESLKELLTVSKTVAADKTPATLSAFKGAEATVIDSIASMVKNIGSISPETENACLSIKNLLNSLQNQDYTNLPTVDNMKLVNDIIQASKNLNRTSAALNKAAKVSAAKVGQVAKEIAYAIDDIVNTSRMASKKAWNFTPLQSKMITAAIEIQNDPLNTRKVIALTKGLALGSESLLKKLQDIDSRTASTISDFLGNLQNLSRAAQLSVSHAPQDISNLRTCASAFENGIKKVAPLVNVLIDDMLTPALAETIAKAAEKLGNAAVAQIRAAAALGLDENNEVMEASLKTTSEVLGESIQELVRACGVLNPSVRECDGAQKVVLDSSLLLESAISAISTGTFKLEGAEKNLPKYQSDAAMLSKGIAETITTMVEKASTGEVLPLASSAARLQEDLPRLVQLAQLVAFSEDDSDSQNDLLDLAKSLVDALGNLIRTVRGSATGDLKLAGKVRDTGAQASDAIGRFLNELQSGAQIVAELEATAKGMEEKLELLESPPTTEEPKKYAELRVDLTQIMKNLTGDVRQVMTVDVHNKGDVGLSTYKLGETSSKLIDVTRSLVNTTQVEEAKLTIKAATTKITQEMNRMIHLVADTVKGKDKREDLKTSFQQISIHIPELMRSVKQGDISEIMMEKSTAKLVEIIQFLNTNAMFVQAGQLEVDDKEMSGLTLLTLQEKLKSSAEEFAKICDSIVDASKVSDTGKAGPLSAELSTQSENLSKITLQNVIKLPTITAQTELLTNVKNMTANGQRVLLAAKDLHERPGDSTALKILTENQNAVRINLGEIFKTVDAVGAEMLRGERVLNSVKLQIENLLSNIPSGEDSSPQQVVVAAREVISSCGDLSFARSQDELIAAGKKAYSGIESLLTSTKSVALRLSPNRDTTDKILAASKDSAKSLCSHIETAKLDRNEEGTAVKLEQSSQTVTLSITDLIDALKLLPNCEHLKLEEDNNKLETMAEAELRKCAEIIEKATSTLLAFKPRERPKVDPTIIDEADINEAILTATRAIAGATHKLVVSAEVAQQQRRESATKAATSGGSVVKYHADPAWANGLISAAQEVAAAVQHLIKSANDSVEGKAQEEALVSTARAVAAATARLVSASKAKSDPNGDAIRNLSAAAKLVATATGRMVDAANKASKFKEEAQEKEDFTGAGLGNLKIQELEIQTKIAQIQRQLEQERQKLAKLRKARYNK
uniref:I/LWEQ domain-containing protein n=1 Tax=Arcella intermedia TaxID=1963864 RepID=A0A6B2KW65_9EUKA